VISHPCAMKLRMNGAPVKKQIPFGDDKGKITARDNRSRFGVGGVLLLGWGVAGMLAPVRGCPVLGRALRRFLQHEDFQPPRPPWFPVSGTRPFACAGLVCGFAGVSDGDFGCGGSSGCGAVCAVAVTIIQ